MTDLERKTVATALEFYRHFLTCRQGEHALKVFRENPDDTPPYYMGGKQVNLHALFELMGGPDMLTPEQIEALEAQFR